MHGSICHCNIGPLVDAKAVVRDFLANRRARQAKVSHVENQDEPITLQSKRVLPPGSCPLRSRDKSW